MNKQFGTVNLEVPNLEVQDVLTILEALDKTIETLKRSNLDSKLECYHLHAEIDKYFGIEVDDEEDEMYEEAVKQSKKKRNKDKKPELKVIEGNQTNK